MEKYLKFISEDALTDDEILLCPITSEDIQLRLGKKLEEKLLYRIFTAFSCIDDFREKIDSIIDKAIQLALDDKEPMWKDIDEIYEEKRQNDD